MPWPGFGDPDIRVLRVSLEDVEPTVWRTLAVRSDTKLPKFNRMLEAVMGWQGHHLHMFEVGELRFGTSDLDDPGLIDERRITVRQVLPRLGSELVWLYDFGDGWSHTVVVEDGDEHPDPGVRFPACIGGERACPPEDCGGPRGYQELMAVLADPAHEEYEELKQWAPADFDPAEFDEAAANQRLHSVR